jgi:hypothetical protein
MARSVRERAPTTVRVATARMPTTWASGERSDAPNLSIDHANEQSRVGLDAHR